MRLLSFFIIFQLIFPISGFSQNTSDDEETETATGTTELSADQKVMIDKLVNDKSYDKRKKNAEKMLSEFITKQNDLSKTTNEGETEPSGYKSLTPPSVDDLESKKTYWRGNYPITLENAQLKFLSDGDIKNYIINYIISHPNYDDLEGIYQINFGNTCSVPVSFASKESKATYLDQLAYQTEAGKAFFDKLAAVYRPGEEDDDPNLKSDEEDVLNKETILAHYKYFSPKSSMINKLLHKGNVSVSKEKRNGVKLLPTEVVSENDMTIQIEDNSAPAPATIEIYTEDLLKDNKEESVFILNDATRTNIKASLLKSLATKESSGKEVKLLGAVCRSSASRISVAANGPSKVGTTKAEFKTSKEEQDTYTDISSEVQKGCEGTNPAGCNHKLSALRRTYCMSAAEQIIDDIRKEKPGMVNAKTSMKPKEFDADKKYYADTIAANYGTLIKKDANFTDKVPFYIFPGTDVGDNGDGTSGPEYYMCASKTYADTHANCKQLNKETGKTYDFPSVVSRDTAGNLKKVNDEISKGKTPSVDLQNAVNADYYHEYQYAEMYFVYLVKDKPGDPISKGIKCKDYSIIQLYMDKDAKKKCLVEDKKTGEFVTKECAGYKDGNKGKKRKHRKGDRVIIIDCKSKSKRVGECPSFRTKRPLCKAFKKLVNKIVN